MLKNLTCIKLQANSKDPIGNVSWREPKYQYTYYQLRNWKGNIGVVTGLDYPDGQLIVIDADSEKIQKLVEAHLPLTFTVKSSKGYHYYYFVSPNINKIVLKSQIPQKVKEKMKLLTKEEQKEIQKQYHYGEIQALGQYVVAPGSIHPDTGLKYEITEDLPIEKISKELLLETFHEFQEPVESEFKSQEKSLSIADVLNHYNITLKNRGNYLCGPHPTHGSSRNEKGTNFNVDLNKNSWHCFQCESGGGPLQLIAVMEGFSDCEHIHKGYAKKYPEAFKRTLVVAKDKFGFNYGNTTLGTINRFYSDTWNAEGFYKMFGQDIKFCTDSGLWLIWSKTHWKEDHTGRINRFAVKFVDSLYKIAQEMPALTDDEIKRQAMFFKHIQTSSAVSKMSAMIELVKSFKGVSHSLDAFDSNDSVVHFQNGTYELDTGTFRNTERSDLNLKRLGVSYNPDATAPRWEQFLHEIFVDENYKTNKDLITFMQKWCGYSLSGSTKEQCFVTLYGSGQNGKSTFIKHIFNILNDYGSRAATDTFMSSHKNSNSNDLASLKGMRGVFSIETEQSKTLNEANIKEITGGDSIRCRFLFKEYFTYTPKFKIFFATNHKPEIVGSDKGIWRRVRLVPFFKEIKDHEKDADIDLVLNKEEEGILNWMLEGYHFWKKEGLGTCQLIEQGTEEYREEMDSIGNFMADCLEFGDDLYCSSQDVFEAYRKWSQITKTPRQTRNEFYAYMRKRGYKSSHKERRYGVNARFFDGFSVSESFIDSKSFNDDRPY